MDRKPVLILLLVVLALSVGRLEYNLAFAQAGNSLAPDVPLSTAFTYQGRLVDGGQPATGNYDLRFILYTADVGGSQIGNVVYHEDVAVNEGYFTVLLDFGSVFDGQGLWMEVSVRSGLSTGAYTPLSPRQSLTAAPFAAYSMRTPWSGLIEIPAGFADGVDNNTTYTAGNGLALSGGQFSVIFAGSGAANTVARSDHNHLSQSWSGLDNALKISGSFDTADSPAPLVLSNLTGTGLQIDSTGKYGVYVGSAGWDGVKIDSAGGTGVSVGASTYYGVSISSAGWAGVLVNSTQGDGLHVNSADQTGVAVVSAGQYGVWAESNNPATEGGHFQNSVAGGTGLFALGGSDTAADLELGGSSASEDNGKINSDMDYSSSDLVLTSNDAIQLNLDEDSDESGHVWVVNGANTTVFTINENGDTLAIGNKSAVVSTQDYGQLKLYAMESPQNWFEDFGSSQLVNGWAIVPIEPVFAQTVNLNEDYFVFLTPLGDCPLYVAQKTALDFTVKAMGGQACDIAFDYRIVAKRMGYESLRLEPATEMVRESDE